MSKAGVFGKPRRRSTGSGTGRRQALAMLDRLVAGKKNRKALMAALEAKLREDPLRFFITMVMPLLPRDATLSADRDGVVVWRARPVDDRAASQQWEARP